MGTQEAILDWPAVGKARVNGPKGCRTSQGRSRVGRTPRLLPSPSRPGCSQPSPASVSLLCPAPLFSQPAAAPGAGPAAEPARAASHALPFGGSTLPTCCSGPEARPARPPGHGVCCSTALSQPAVDTKAWGVLLSCWYQEGPWRAGPGGQQWWWLAASCMPHATRARAVCVALNLQAEVGRLSSDACEQCGMSRHQMAGGRAAFRQRRQAAS